MKYTEDTKQDTKVGPLSADTSTMSNFPVKPYQGRWCFRSDFTDNKGQRKQIRRSFDTEKEAITEYIKFIAAREAGAVVASNGLTMDELFVWWFGLLKDAGTQHNTIELYEYLLGHYASPVIGKIKASKLTTDHLRELYRGMSAQGLASSTIQGIHRRIRTCLKAALLDSKVEYNIADRVSPAKGTAAKKHVILTPEQVAKLLETARSDRLAALWVLACTTGMRRGELAGLTWDQIDFKAKSVTIDKQRTIAVKSGVFTGSPKSLSSARTMVLPDAVFAVLGEWSIRQQTERMMLRGLWAGDNHVFTSRDGTPYHPASLTHMTGKLMEKAGVPKIPLHGIRHSVATNALRARVDTTVMAAFLGHANGRITAQYYQHADTDMVWELTSDYLNSIVPPVNS